METFWEAIKQAVVTMVTFGRGLSGDGGLFSQHSCSWKGRCDQALRLVKEKKKVVSLGIHHFCLIQLR